MTHWNDGYVSDVTYTDGYYQQQMPAHLDAACLVAGIEPPVAPDARYTYCELGCGLGGTAMAIAASDPRAEVWGFDFNPGHIAHARSMALQAGLDNVHFEERSFEELAQAPPGSLPAFDYVTLHGVWSWVSSASQANLVTFMRRYVRPGGLVYVSYNAMPGWTGSIPLQHLLREAGRLAGGTSERRMHEAMFLARRVAETGVSAIDAASLSRITKAYDDGHTSYVIHEYLNEHWRPAFFADVAYALAPAKLDYACSANLIENFPELCIKKDQLALVNALPPDLKQTVQDFFCPRTFRRDIFIRGARPLPVMAKAARLDGQRLTRIVPAKFSENLKVEIPLGEATLNAAFYEPAFSILAERTASISELRAAADPDTVPAVEEILGLLLESKEVALASGTADPVAVARARRFNRERLNRNAAGAVNSGWIVGTVISLALRVGLVEMLVYEVAAAHADVGSDVTAETLVPEVFALMKARSMTVKTEIPEAKDGLIREIRVVLEASVPLWRTLGAL